MAIWRMAQVFWTLCCVSSQRFLKQLASHVSTAMFQLKVPGMKFFLIHPRHRNIFLEGLKVFCVVLMKHRSSHIKKKEKHDVSLIHCFLFERVSLIYCFTFFRNQLWRHLISHDNFINMNMCLLEVAMCERHRRSHFQSFEDWWKGG